ncbi:hypothetical protein [Paenibacillus sp. 22594]|uniref:hypothetical protein n=1 Tax=Paenibacillus sp. 22594 TaxID=3453947 RepID=UPI003F86B654
MMDLKLAQSFALTALNAQSSLYMTNAKKVSLRSMAAAVILEAYLEGYFTQADNELTFRKEVLDQSSSTLYRETVLLPLLHNHAEVQGDLGWWLKKASMLPNKKLKKFEIAISD